MLIARCQVGELTTKTHAALHPYATCDVHLKLVWKCGKITRLHKSEVTSIESGFPINPV